MKNIWKQKKIKVKELPSGDTLNINVISVSGHPGPHIYLQAGIHGAEVQGNALIIQLIDFLKSYKATINGTITMVPLANPNGTNNKNNTYTNGRFNANTGDNWNRNFIDLVTLKRASFEKFCHKNKQTENKVLFTHFKKWLKQTLIKIEKELKDKNQIHENNEINLILQKLAIEADGVLDLHTGPIATYYLYTPEYAKEVSKYLKFENTLVIPHYFAGAFDEVTFHPYTELKKYFFSEFGRDLTLPFESFTLELGSEEAFDLESGKRDVARILPYLKYKGVFPSNMRIKPSPIKNQTIPLENFKTIYSKQSGLFHFDIKPGETFKKGDVIGRYFNAQKIKIKNNKIDHLGIEELKADYSGKVINIFPSAVVPQGCELLQVFKY
ncbi:succinylglutamate desuccinylase/aspartoacylase family protein [Bacteriovoracaceae bacterium]|nr:succinylglutamate desuccinylase/aspartoacylase family protein [Bacteriovoracaceae bacterium]